MYRVDTFIKQNKVSSYNSDLKSNRYLGHQPNPFFIEADFYEEDKPIEVCPCCIDKVHLDFYHKKKKKFSTASEKSGQS